MSVKPGSAGYSVEVKKELKKIKKIKKATEVTTSPLRPPYTRKVA